MNTGIVVAACTRATITVDELRDVMSQAAAVFCIQVPILETKVATQRVRKKGCPSGSQAVPPSNPGSGTHFLP